jgi:hypothetical protein
LEFTSTEIRDAIEHASPQPSTFEKPEGQLQTEAEFQKILTQVSGAITSDPDSVWYLIKLSAVAIAEKILSLQTASARIRELLGNISVSPPASAPDLSQLDNIEGHLRAMDIEKGETSRARRQSLVNSSVRAFSDSIGAVKGGTPVLRPKEASQEVAVVLATVLEEFDEITARQAQLDLVLEEYLSGSLLDAHVRGQSERSSEILEEVRGNTISDPEGSSRDSLLKLLTSQSLLSGSHVLKDPSDTKLSATLSAAGTSTKARVDGTGTAPFTITAANQAVSLVVDGAATAWTLPLSTKAALLSGDLGAGIPIETEHVATLLSTPAATYSMQYPASATVLARNPVLTNVFLASAALPAGVAVGDLVWLGAMFRIEHLDYPLLYLDGTPAASGYTNPTFLFDNRMTFSVDGDLLAPVSFPAVLNPSGGYNYTTISHADIVANMQPAGTTASSFGGSVRWISNNVSSGSGHLSIVSCPFATMLGLTGASSWDSGAYGNDKLVIEVDGAEIPVITLTAGASRTAAQLAVDITAGAGIAAVDVSGALRVETDTPGTPGTVRTLTVHTDTTVNTASNAIGLQMGVASDLDDALVRGEDVTVQKLRQSVTEDLEDVFTLGDVREDRTPNGTATSVGTAVLTFPAVPAGVLVGDTLEIVGEPERGAYTVVGPITAIKVTVDRPVAAGTYDTILYRQAVYLESKKTDLTSAIAIVVTHATLGLTAGETRGEVEQLLSATALSTVTKPPVRVGDNITLSGYERSITAIDTDTLSFADGIPNDVSASGVIEALGDTLYADLVQDLADWRAERAAGSFPGTLDGLVSLVKEALYKSKTTVANASLVELEALMASLEAALQPYDAVKIPTIDQAVASLRERRLDRGADLLSYGKLEELFGSDSQDASYANSAAKALADVALEFPVLEDTDPEEENAAGMSGSVDPELDFSDTSGEQLEEPIPDTSADDDDDLEIYA